MIFAGDVFAREHHADRLIKISGAGPDEGQRDRARRFDHQEAARRRQKLAFGIDGLSRKEVAQANQSTTAA